MKITPKTPLICFVGVEEFRFASGTTGHFLFGLGVGGTSEAHKLLVGESCRSWRYLLLRSMKSLRKRSHEQTTDQPPKSSKSFEISFHEHIPQRHEKTMHSQSHRAERTQLPNPATTRPGRRDHRLRPAQPSFGVRRCCVSWCSCIPSGSSWAPSFVKSLVVSSDPS